MTHTTPAGANIFEDIGFPPDEARNLLMRSRLMLAAKRFIEERGLTQTEAAELMGTTQPRISDLMRGRISQFTIDSLVNMLTKAGVPVEIEIGETAA
ncbi:MAG: helix-turn-helix transcriptional regulator [Longimicrobiales bacterium]